MKNHIAEVHLLDLRLDPAEAEVGITVVPERVTSTTMVRGRLMGPRCLYSSTVEVAYSLRPWSREYESEGFPRIMSRVIIPEACFWDPESPFLYQGPVELWQDGQRCDVVQVSHGLRSLNLGKQGLRWNGRPLTIRGVVRRHLPEEEALRLRREGYNTLVVPVSAETAEVWEAADRYGFLVLGRIEDAREALAQMGPLSTHPCCLGWLWPQRLLENQWTALMAMSSSRQGEFIGVELSEQPLESPPDRVHFVCCREGQLLPEGRANLPQLLLAASEPAILDSPGILGWLNASV